MWLTKSDATDQSNHQPKATHSLGEDKKGSCSGLGEQEDLAGLGDQGACAARPLGCRQWKSPVKWASKQVKIYHRNHPQRSDWLPGEQKTIRSHHGGAYLGQQRAGFEHRVSWAIKAAVMLRALFLCLIIWEIKGERWEKQKRKAI